MANRILELISYLVAMSLRCKQDMIHASIFLMILLGKNETASRISVMEQTSAPDGADVLDQKIVLGKNTWPDGGTIPSLRVPSNWGQDRRAGNA